jgi:hypothetical protein
MGSGRHPFAIVSLALFALAPRPSDGAVSTVGCANATSCTLAELFSGGAIVVNGRTFGNWELEFIDTDGVQPDFSLVVVEGRADGGIDPGPGLEFQGNGQLAVVGEDRLDLALNFTVSPAANFVDNSLTLLSQTVAGAGFLRVGEFVADANGIGIGQKNVESDPAFGVSILTDAIVFPTPPGLIIEKDILLVGGAPGDAAALDVFEQRYALPEPEGSLMLCAGAGVLWGLAARRGRRAARVEPSNVATLNPTSQPWRSGS